MSENASEIILQAGFTDRSELRNQGITVYVTTHDLELILDCCTDIIHFAEGKIVEQYPMDEQGLAKIREYFVRG